MNSSVPKLMQGLNVGLLEVKFLSAKKTAATLRCNALDQLEFAVAQIPKLEFKIHQPVPEHRKRQFVEACQKGNYFEDIKIIYLYNYICFIKYNAFSTLYI